MRKLRRAAEFLVRHSTVLTNLSIPIIGSVSGVLLARALGPADRAVFALIQTLPAVVGAVASVGMAEALAYSLARSKSVLERYSMLLSALRIVATASVVVIGIFLVSAPWTLGAVDADYRSASFLAAAYLPSLTFGAVIQGWCRGRNQIVTWNVARLLPGVLWAVGVTVVYAAGPSVYRMSVALATAGAGFLLLCLAAGLSDLKRLKATTPRHVGPLVRYGWPSALATLPRLANVRFDQLLLIAFLPAADVGLYIAAVGWSGFVPAIATARAMSSFPTIAALEPVQRWDPVRGVLVRGATLAAAVGSISALAAPVFFPVVFGAAFASGRLVASAMSGVAAAMAMMTITHNLLLACGLSKRVLAVDIAALLVTIPTLVVLTPIFEVWAAVIASGMAYSVATGLGVVFLFRASGGESRHGPGGLTTNV